MDTLTEPHPNAHLLNPQAVAGMEAALANPGEWVTWQECPHANASKTMAYRLRAGLRQRIITQQYGNKLSFHARAIEDKHYVQARYIA